MKLGKTIKELVNDMNPIELIWWKGYFDYRPFGDLRDDMRTALSTKFSLMPYTKKDSVLSIEDFMLQAPEKKMPESKDLAAKCELFFGGSKNG